MQCRPFMVNKNVENKTRESFVDFGNVDVHQAKDNVALYVDNYTRNCIRRISIMGEDGNYTTIARYIAFNLNFYVITVYLEGMTRTVLMVHSAP